MGLHAMMVMTILRRYYFAPSFVKETGKSGCFCIDFCEKMMCAPQDTRSTVWYGTTLPNSLDACKRMVPLIISSGTSLCEAKTFQQNHIVLENIEV